MEDPNLDVKAREDEIREELETEKNELVGIFGLSKYLGGLASLLSTAMGGIT